jgi:hypothetical protein
MQLMAFTDEQLRLIGEIAQPVPWARRRAYLDRVTELLSGQEYGNKDVRRAAVQAQRELIGMPAPE